MKINPKKNLFCRTKNMLQMGFTKKEKQCKTALFDPVSAAGSVADLQRPERELPIDGSVPFGVLGW